MNKLVDYCESFEDTAVFYRQPVKFFMHWSNSNNVSNSVLVTLKFMQVFHSQATKQGVVIIKLTAHKSIGNKNCTIPRQMTPDSPEILKTYITLPTH